MPFMKGTISTTSGSVVGSASTLARGTRLVVFLSSTSFTAAGSARLVALLGLFLGVMGHFLDGHVACQLQIGIICIGNIGSATQKAQLPLVQHHVVEEHLETLIVIRRRVVGARKHSHELIDVAQTSGQLIYRELVGLLAGFQIALLIRQIGRKKETTNISVDGGLESNYRIGMTNTDDVPFVSSASTQRLSKETIELVGVVVTTEIASSHRIIKVLDGTKDNFRIFILDHGDFHLALFWITAYDDGVHKRSVREVFFICLGYKRNDGLVESGAGR